MTPLDLAADLTERLDRLGIPYVIGGSLASTLVGEPRSTADVDIAIELTAEHLPALLADVSDDFYAPGDSARRAVELRSSFNLIPNEGGLKVDLFVLGDSLLDRNQLERRVAARLPSVPPRTVWVTSPEDVILRKLRWYIDGDRASDRQWRDIIGVLEVQAERLDNVYLDVTSSAVGLRSDLDRARRQVR